jgi:lipopolysaccharide export LptBFGC system permease protein LptF
MSDASAADDSKHIEELYQYVESLNEAKDKSQVRFRANFHSFCFWGFCVSRVLLIPHAIAGFPVRDGLWVCLGCCRM